MELKHMLQQFLKISVILLIVPYGIETNSIYQGLYVAFSFNRTLWN